MTLTETFEGVDMELIKQMTGCTFKVANNLKVNNY